MKPESVLITGISRGLGRALLEKFVAEGSRVFGCARSQVAIDELQEKHGVAVELTQLDVADAGSVASWAADIAAQGTIPEIIVNNAGVINTNARLWEVSAGEFQKVVDVNICGTANIIRSFTPLLIEQKRGTIVNFSSEWGRSTSAEVAPYCASKWAIEGLSQALAQELPRGMCCVALSPGIIDTDMLRSCFGDLAAGYPGPGEWAAAAYKTICALKPADSGKQRNV